MMPTTRPLSFCLFPRTNGDLQAPMKGPACGATALLAFALPLLLLLLISRTVTGSTENSRAQCEAAVKKWAEHEIWTMEEARQGQVHGKWKLQDLLFFLHIPRTGGRNYNQCFLKNLFVEDELCPRSYDKLRFDPSKPHCSLFSTHDDYSIVTRFPRASTSIITNMRDPTHRVLSAYEFSVEVAARFLRRSKTFVRRSTVGPKSPMKSMSTLDIWPWKYLVPLLQHDLFDRRDLRLAGALPSPEANSNVYDVPSHVMPLKEFIDHPVVHEIIHNGATFQVAGITNNSYVEDANEVRSCVAKYEELGDHVLSVAKRRLDGMLYVGLTEKHKESAEVFAHLVGHQVAKRKLERASKEINGNSSKRQKDAKTAAPVDLHPISSDAANDTSSEDFIDQMVTSYQRCSSTIRSAQVSRRISSLDAVAPVNFSKETRKTIPEDVLARILQLNSLDFELYQHAKKLFEVEQDFLKNHANELKKLDDNKIDRRTTFSTNTKHAQRIWRVVEPSTSFVIGASIFISLLGMYFFINYYFSRRDRPRAKFQSLKK